MPQEQDAKCETEEIKDVPVSSEIEEADEV